MDLELWTFTMNAGLTENWHSGGTALVSASNKMQARRRLQKHVEKLGGGLDWDDLEEEELVGRTDKYIIRIYEDAGCC